LLRGWAGIHVSNLHSTRQATDHLNSLILQAFANVWDFLATRKLSGSVAMSRGDAFARPIDHVGRWKVAGVLGLVRSACLAGPRSISVAQGRAELISHRGRDDAHTIMCSGVGGALGASERFRYCDQAPRGSRTVHTQRRTLRPSRAAFRHCARLTSVTLCLLISIK
jgi:hypothetical protein